MEMILPPACALCGKNEFQPVATEQIEGKILGIQKCSSCGLHFVWPRLDNHQEPYKAFTEESFNKKYGAISRGERLHDRHQNYLEEVELVRTYAKKDAHVLDVGCNAGWLLGYLKNANFAIEGVEPSNILADIAHRRTGAVIHNCYLHEVQDRDGAFDCIMATDVIEHITPENINQFIVSMYRLLKPGGRVIIKTPNVKYTYAKYLCIRVIPVALRKHFLKAMDLWNAKEHVLQWDDVTLSSMFKKHQLEPVAIFVPKPIETKNTPIIPRTLRKVIYAAAQLWKGSQHIPWFAQDICLIAERKVE